MFVLRGMIRRHIWGMQCGGKRFRFSSYLKKNNKPNLMQGKIESRWKENAIFYINEKCHLPPPQKVEKQDEKWTEKSQVKCQITKTY